MPTDEHTPPPIDATVVDIHDSAVSVEKAGKPNVPAKLDIALPDRLLALPLTQRPVFPSMMLPLVVPAGRLADGVRLAIEQHQGHIGFFLTQEPLEDTSAFTAADLRQVGAIARVLKAETHESGGIQVLANVLARWAITEIEQTEPHVIVRGRDLRAEVDKQDRQVRALVMAIVTALKGLAQHNPVFADEIQLVLANFNNIDGPGRLADLAATLTTASRDELQSVLETIAIPERMQKVLGLLAKETDLAQLKGRIQAQIEQKLSDHQRKFFLNEQLKAIKQELGLETDEKSLELQRLGAVLEKKRQAMPEEARGAADEELRKLSLLEPASAEYGVSRSRLEWLLELPWGVTTSDHQELMALRGGLDADHYGLDEVKARLVEFVAVRHLKQDQGGGIICLVGPPGTGKTSVGASIARQLGRTFYRFAVGGMRDEAEIRGHRRTYIGALPGKMVQALRRCGSMNPVILLDEIDKLGRGVQGDPAAALLEVLDPEQNKDFLDHYLDLRIDLSQVLFVCTANELEGIPEPLQDRMEIIRLAGYIESEKLAIASRWLVPKQRKAHGLSAQDIGFSPAALRGIIRGYAREAGVRRLEQLIARICRKVATRKAEAQAPGNAKPPRKSRPQVARATIRITPQNLKDFLGKPLITDEELMPHATPGVVTGLAWTALGGATLEIEAIAIPAKESGLTLSGQLGDVMKESAGLALSWLRAHGASLGVVEGWFDRHKVHLHVPAGAIPKDGPSAGITMATALLSLALGRPVKRRLGMTGELTLTGRVYPIGGVREKMVAAKRAGLKEVLLPAANERDWDELPTHLQEGYAVRFVRELGEVVRLAGLQP